MKGDTMTHKTDKEVWFITGAGRGMGVDFAKAVAKSDDLLAVKCDLSTSLAFDQLEAAGSAR
jgi:NAD(P)-dependent dehydrogenase (short-subunit alcohol dehydrogenase family)